MRISDWSSDVCSSDLFGERAAGQLLAVLVESDGPGAAWDGCQQQRALLLLQGLRRQGPAFLDFRHLNRPAQAPGVEIIEIVSGAGLHAADGQQGYSHSSTRASSDRKSTRLNSSH